MRDITSKSNNVGDLYTADQFNSNQVEREGLVTSAGISLDPSIGPDTDTQMMSKAVSVYAMASQTYTDSGSANTYVLTRTNANLVTPDNLVNGMVVLFSAANTNTGASTVNVGGSGVLDLVDHAGSALSASDIVAGNIYFIEYNATNDEWRRLNSGTAGVDVTFENLDANGDVGTGSDQVAVGNHTHDDRYYTESESDSLLAGKSDTGHTHDASAITSGTIDIARLPSGALERLVSVADQTARYALTTTEVQLGDSVRQIDTGVMYIVIDEGNLNNSAGYQEYTAGTATSVPWSGITSKPTDLLYGDLGTTDNVVLRANGTGQYTAQGSSVTIDDSNNIDTPGTITGSRLISDVSTGTAPVSVSSTTLCSNLNADLLDGVQGSNYVRKDIDQTLSNIVQVNPPGDVWNENTQIWGAFGGLYTGGSFRTTLTCNHYRNTTGSAYLGVNGITNKGSAIDLDPSGTIYLRGGTAVGIQLPTILEANYDTNTLKFKDKVVMRHADNGSVQIPTLASDPSTDLALGQMYVRTSDNALRFYNGSAWVTIS